MTSSPLVPGDFAVPAGLRSELFVIEPPGARHNLADGLHPSAGDRGGHH